MNCLGDTGFEIGKAFEPIKEVTSYEMTRAAMPWAGRVVFQHRAKDVA